MMNMSKRERERIVYLVYFFAGFIIVKVTFRAIFQMNAYYGNTAQHDR
jgi:hypothetical protein